MKRAPKSTRFYLQKSPHSPHPIWVARRSSFPSSPIRTAMPAPGSPSEKSPTLFASGRNRLSCQTARRSDSQRSVWRGRRTEWSMPPRPIKMASSVSHLLSYFRSNCRIRTTTCASAFRSISSSPRATATLPVRTRCTLLPTATEQPRRV